MSTQLPEPTPPFPPDPIPDPEPASPPLDEPDPGVFHHDPVKPPPAPASAERQTAAQFTAE